VCTLFQVHVENWIFVSYLIYWNKFAVVELNRNLFNYATEEKLKTQSYFSQLDKKQKCNDLCAFSNHVNRVYSMLLKILNWYAYACI